MPMDPQLARQLRQIATYQVSLTTANIYGETTLGSTATAYCRLESRVRHVERIDGTYEVTREPLLIIDSSAFTPTMAMAFWLPGTPLSAAFARKPKYIEVCVDEFGGINHWEVQV